MKLLIPLLLLFSQVIQQSEPDLTTEYIRATSRGSQPTQALFTIISTLNGKPNRQGKIWCEGIWYVQADESDITIGDDIWFSTDSRGAAIFNPMIGEVGNMQTCVAADSTGLRRQSLTFKIMDGAIYRINIP